MRAHVQDMRRAVPMLALACALACPEAIATPDLARGLAALERGELPAAEANLLPLAEQGYPEAQLALGRLYAGQDTPASAAKAVRWFRAVATKDPSMRVPLARMLMRVGGTAELAEVDRLLKAAVKDQDSAALPMQLRLYREFPGIGDPARGPQLAQQVSTSNRVEDRAEAIAWYRDNAVQPAYAQALVKLCEQDRKEIEECYPDLARHFRAAGEPAAQTKLHKEALERFEQSQISARTLERIARVLSADDLPGAPSPAVAYALLKKLKEPSPEALARKARLVLADPNLDPKAEPVAWLKIAYDHGSMEAALQLGRIYLDERSPDVDPLEAERLFAQAAQTLPAAHFYLGRMLERGHRGQTNMQRAHSHYLLAARAGYSRADLALAQMYWNNRGVKVDAVSAYAFSRIAMDLGVVGAPELLGQLRGALKIEEIARGQKLAEQELAARRAAVLQPVGIPLTTAGAKTP